MEGGRRGQNNYIIMPPFWGILADFWVASKEHINLKVFYEHKCSESWEQSERIKGSGLE